MKLSTLVCLAFLSLAVNLHAQKKEVISYSFKKGEVMDVMLITTAPNSEKLYDKYRKTAFPVAFEYGYQPQSGFKISKLTLGTHFPKSIIFGKWTNKEKREGFLDNIAERVPDFHSLRRGLFPHFDLTYYEMNRDMSFSINRKKYHVATSFWKGNSGDFTKFFKKWKKDITKSGGKLIIELENGTSPLGYYYNPTVFCIVAWDSQQDFEAFSKQNPLSTYDTLKNIHQFAID